MLLEVSHRSDYFMSRLWPVSLPVDSSGGICWCVRLSEVAVSANGGVCVTRAVDARTTATEQQWLACKAVMLFTAKRYLHCLSFALATKSL